MAEPGTEPGILALELEDSLSQLLFYTISTPPCSSRIKVWRDGDEKTGFKKFPLQTQIPKTEFVFTKQNNLWMGCNYKRPHGLFGQRVGTNLPCSHTGKTEW